MNCRICDCESRSYAKARVLHRHPVEYYLCGQCGFVQTQEPVWLAEAYSEAIASSDIGLLSRNLYLSSITSTVISCLFNPAGCFLDYGAGYGVFVRLMRDRGFDFSWEDPFCKNLFAQGFESETDRRYELVTAFEVFEHLPDPASSLQGMLKRSDKIFFSTELLPPGPPKPEDWWYYALDSGQHVALYSKTALTRLGEKFGLHFHTNGRSLHLFTKSKVSPFWFRLACSNKFASIWNQLRSRPSLLSPDHKLVMERLKKC